MTDILYPPDLRETRLRVRIDELRFKSAALVKQNQSLRRRCELKNAKIAALGREVRALAAEVERLERAAGRCG